MSQVVALTAQVLGAPAIMTISLGRAQTISGLRRFGILLVVIGCRR